MSPVLKITHPDRYSKPVMKLLVEYPGTMIYAPQQLGTEL